MNVAIVATRAPERVTRADRARSLHGIYVILNDDPRMLELAQAVLDAGVRIVQYRAKRGIVAEHVLALRDLTRRNDALLIVNDDWRATEAFDCDGVHLGPGDDGFDQLSRCALPCGERLIGLSCGTTEEARAADARRRGLRRSRFGLRDGVEKRCRRADRNGWIACGRGGDETSRRRGRRHYRKNDLADVRRQRRRDGGRDFRDFRQRATAPSGDGTSRCMESLRWRRDRFVNSIVLSIGTTHPWNVAGVGRDLVVGCDFGVRVFTAIVAVSAQDGRGVSALHAGPTRG